MAQSSTATIGSSVELRQLPAAVVGGTGSRRFSNEIRRLGSNDNDNSNIGVVGLKDIAEHTAPVDLVETWKYPRQNIFKTGATFWSLLVTGANDAAYGLESYYDLSYVVVSLIFLSPFVGYILAASLNNTLHVRIGQRGIGVSCGLCHFVAYVIISQHPAYPALVIAYALAGFGNGVSDAAWNAWVGSLDRANEVLGLLHAFYGIGGTTSPLIATSMIARAGLPWYKFYYIMISMSAVELVSCTWAFWHDSPEAYRRKMRASSEDSAGMREALFRMPYARVTWLSALFLLGYVGVEVSLGGWVVQFMMRVRKAEAFPAGMTSVGFWLGLTVGRAVLGFVTPTLGVKVAVAMYLPATMALELVFWLVPRFTVSAVAVALQGFFLGPLFPAVVVIITKLLPRHLHVSTIGFAAAFGGSGAAVLPFAVGAIAQARGVQILQPIILAFLAMLLGVWLCLPRIGKKRD
ncbi:Major Facilitator Superfamily [Geosmithia morbida]|uniref:Major Facilitator Superfamily n=1 Tax=Geosmithia morbida TaxID=1094350 RepID=A0A9P5D686_9HYPO|nr:Major Facilitator Superfamily [Geosmithia morbida]KAF4124520.1 Major Facilitator Superfamily [Geosmithia morbida]